MLMTESFFTKFRNNIIGINSEIDCPDGNSRKILYADWTASGRCYKPIEDIITNKLLPFIANTHTDTNSTGAGMTYAYHKAQKIIKKHVNAGSDDILISAGTGMTGVVNKLQRILGLRVHEKYKSCIDVSPADKPVVFITHMEHHSNQTSWIETIADVVIIEPNAEGLVDLENFANLLEEYSERTLKIAAVTSCSNVTGIFSPYYEIAKIIHKVGGYCFVDFACSAPYINIDMHPEDNDARLDAIYFSPHKFLGGPGSAGVLIFNKALYKNSVPDNPGGGTVEWTNPWMEHKYINDIEMREDGGTPGFLQTMRTALSIKLKEAMGVENILKREHEILEIMWNKLSNIANIHILASNIKERLGVVSFYIDNLHFNLGVKILNDRFGIQTRGGCSCAGTYGHYLLNVNPNQSSQITCKINEGDYSDKPGWIRASIHPTMTDFEINQLCDSIIALAENYEEWSKDYTFDKAKGIIRHISQQEESIIKHIDNAFNEL
ncbi:MAG: aminotransferase class V-fold PLP-dependent enzyme [Candidatus Kapabacteria bacterium]|nr:aminotransferase class V-fold PLP-dependent enzyme [Ignavibacteriota bacterium]MCW5885214.1 aminotransferase class V-fold PLP-dependent enzyme [Candidatus Kapabacteria bacterium]